MIGPAQRSINIQLNTTAHAAEMDNVARLRALFDDLSKRVAQVELAYRDLGIKFFSLPLFNRQQYFRIDLENAQRMFAALEGNGQGEPHVSESMCEVRAMLDEARRHFYRLNFEHIRDAELKAVKEKLFLAEALHTQIKRQVYPWVPNMGGVYRSGVPRIPMAFVENLPGGGLPRDDGDARYGEFCRWALTVREVQNSIALGASEDEAIAMLCVKTPETEQRLIPDLGEVDPTLLNDDEDEIDEADGGVPDDGEYDADAESNAFSDSNPHEIDSDDEGDGLAGGVPVSNEMPHSGAPPPDFQSS